MAGANGLALVRSGGEKPFIPVGGRSRILLRLLPLDRLFFIFLLGMVFAVSFDTLSQTLAFSLAASETGGIREILGVGLFFTVGMMLSDGTNGLWISCLVARADERGIRLSRAMGWAVVFLRFLVGVILFLSLTYLLAGRFIPDRRP